MLFGTYVHDRELGILLAANTGFLVARNPDTVLAPDLAFVCAKRLPRGPLPDGYWIGPPDLAMETVSFSDTATGIELKAEEWLSAGCPLVWVVHPRRKTITVYRPQDASQPLGIDDRLTGEDVVPGFQIPVAEIFA
jgi:Uma2 family endonuclease